MPTYKTPGVYIQVVNLLRPTVPPVETAIPAFIGYTERAHGADGDSVENRPTRVSSLSEFEQRFGGAPAKTLEVSVEEAGGTITVTFNADPGLPEHFLYFGMKLYFANGGGPCYVVSIGGYDAVMNKRDFTAAIEALQVFDEPTLIVFPDACLLPAEDYGDVVNTSLMHCKKMRDRFTIADVPDALPGSIDTDVKVTANFRDKIAADPQLLRYGAAYFPYVQTSIPWRADETAVVVKTHTVDGSPGSIAANASLDSIKASHTAVYRAVRQFVSAATVTTPPSPGMAGIYVRTDRSRGVWKAPANESFLSVVEPAIPITNDFNNELNVHVRSGKSINAIRDFPGKGTLVWGARTLAGNDTENRYVPVRRYLIFAEESIKKATTAFASEPNDATTWAKVRSMTESFLLDQWRKGALAGATPGQAYYVRVGLNQTMTAEDIRRGRMIVEMGVAVIQPAEFNVVRFEQKMQTS